VLPMMVVMRVGVNGEPWAAVRMWMGGGASALKNK